jgi:hypothetical protein
MISKRVINFNGGDILINYFDSQNNKVLSGQEVFEHFAILNAILKHIELNGKKNRLEAILPEVISPELSKELKEAGVPQLSAFYWVYDEKNVGYLCYRGLQGRFYISITENKTLPISLKANSAFLPFEIEVPASIKGKYFYTVINNGNEIICGYHSGVDWYSDKKFASIIEADAKANLKLDILKNPENYK